MRSWFSAHHSKSFCTALTEFSWEVGSCHFISGLISSMEERRAYHDRNRAEVQAVVAATPLISVASYPGRATSSRGASVEAALTKLPESLEGHHVLIIDDILDSGTTLRLVRRIVEQRNPVSTRSCVLLRKDRPEASHST